MSSRPLVSSYCIKGASRTLQPQTIQAPIHFTNHPTPQKQPWRQVAEWRDQGDTVRDVSFLHKSTPNHEKEKELTSFHHRHLVPLASKQVASVAPKFLGSLIASMNGFVVSTTATFTPAFAFVNASTFFVNASLYCTTALPSAATFSAPDANTVGLS